MAKLYKRNKTWCADIRIGGKRLRRALSTDRRLADTKLAKLIRQRDAKRHGDVLAPDLVVFRKKYLESRENDMASRTHGHDRLAFERLEKAFPAAQKVDDITPELLVDLKNKWVAENLRPSAVNRGLRSIKCAMKTAKAWYKLEAQDWESVGRVKETKGKTLWYEVGELLGLFRRLRGQWLTVGMLAFEFGLRRGEIRELKWTRVIFARNAISIGPYEGWTPKSEEGNRFIPMKPGLRKYLEELYRGRTNEYVVPKRPALDSMTSYFCRLVRKAGMKGSLHTLRHSFGAHLAQAGVPLAWIGKMMGHSNERVTELYGHLQTITPESALEALPDLWPLLCPPSTALKELKVTSNDMVPPRKTEVYAALPTAV